MAKGSETFTIGQRTGNISVGALLILLYAICVTLLVVGFSAYVIRTDWNGALANNGAELRDLDTLRFLVKRDEELEALIAAAQDDIARADDSILITVQAENTTSVQYDRAQTSLRETVMLAHAHLSEATAHLAEGDNARLYRLIATQEDKPMLAAVNAGFFQLPLMSFRDTIEPQKRQQILSDASDLSARLTELSDQISSLTLAVQNAESNTQRAHEERSFHLKRQNSHQAALDELRKSVPIYSEHRTRWISLADAGWWNPLPQLVSTPTILLTLMVTIAAGALGTLVAYSRSTFLEQRVPSGSRLLIILGEGIAAAIGVFLFAGAGMLVLSQGGGPDGRLELSPFTVAFLAFLSGFMAESAFNKISNFGTDFFGKGTDTNADAADGDAAAKPHPVAPPDPVGADDAPKPAT
ncbi:hypothetical protein [Aestuariivita sp.]|jgi:outer membrane murein-binding lipoprotein Lpp|uniref:hypothetical protein n=1 Tax=Aestuariivita sp. TaxID=1872407 RepID=UPI002171441D|nr:hypothetical protein [Aestuariivita sp.]MCE8009273.1 hypothetical protein [Aestuariivita sp.]